MDVLLSELVITKDDCEEVRHFPRQQDRNKALLDILIGRPYDTFPAFIKALKTSGDQYEELVKRIELSKTESGHKMITKSHSGKII